VDKALAFFKEVIGREASPSEQRGDFGLDVLLVLIDARVPIVAQKMDDEYNAKLRAQREALDKVSAQAAAERESKVDSETKVEPAKPDPENGATPFSEAPAGSES
jgi:hypothetical protein